MPVRTIAGTDLSYALVVFDDKGNERARARRHAPERDPGAARRRSGPAGHRRLLHRSRLAGRRARRDRPIRPLDRGDGGAAGRPRRGREAPGRLRAADHRPALAEPAVRRREDAGRRAGRAVGRRRSASAAGSENVDAWAARIADTPRARAAIRHDPRRRRAGDRRRSAVAGAARRLRDAVRRVRPRRARQRGARRAPTRRASIRPRSSPASERRRGQAGDRSCSASATRVSGLFLSPLRQLSFWKMKDRARAFGESGGHDAARSPADRGAARALPPDGPQLRLHRRLGHGRGPGRRARRCRGRSTRCSWSRARCRSGRTRATSRTPRERRATSTASSSTASCAARSSRRARRTTPPSAASIRSARRSGSSSSSATTCRRTAASARSASRAPKGVAGHADARGELRLRLQAGSDLQPRGERDHQERRRRVGRAQRHRPSRGRARVLVGGAGGAAAADGNAVAGQRQRAAAAAGPGGLLGGGLRQLPAGGAPCGRRAASPGSRPPPRSRCQTARQESRRADARRPSG